MNFSLPFIRRPIGTTLLASGIFLVGMVAYGFLPVASLPTVDFPTIHVNASRPGAEPAVMAATVAAPLERRLGEISGVTDLTSVSQLGQSRITIQFDLNRNIEGAARDVQAALNAALSDLPGDMPTLPTFRKANPAASPILILALTSKTMRPSAIYDVADSVIAQRLSQVQGVADVTVAGAEQPAIRVRVDPTRLAAMGLSLEDVRTAISNANAAGPVGMFDGVGRAVSIGTNDQLRNPNEYDALAVKTANGTVVRLSSIANVTESSRNSRAAGWFNKDPSVLLIITKQTSANVIETVDRIYELLPELRQWVPAGLEISVLSDRTHTIRASVGHMQVTLGITVMLVMFVIFVFLRRAAPMAAAGITVPLTLSGTCALMWAAGFSIDNLSLMALAASVGFIVDDAIVMIENTFRHLERGASPLRAALQSARQIGFTVLSISISLVAAFVPLLFMGGVVGRLFREFSVTLVFAIIISTAVSLSVTPMICAHFVRHVPSTDATRFDRIVNGLLSSLVRFYDRTLLVALAHRSLTLIIFIVTLILSVGLYIKTPKGYFPQDDTGLIFGGTLATADISFEAMKALQLKVRDVVLDDPAVAGVGTSIGASPFNAAVNFGRLFISLKPIGERGGISSLRVIARMRPKLAQIPGIRVFMFPSQDLRVGGRQTDSQYQFTLWSSDLDELNKWVPRVYERVKQIPGLVDVTSDRDEAGFQVNISIDRQAAARLGVRVQDIDNSLNNSFSQRQVSTVYGARNQYRVILEVDRKYQRDPSDLSRVYVSGGSNVQIPLSAVTEVDRGRTPTTVSHLRMFPSVTISYNLHLDTTLEEAVASIEQAIAEMHLPDLIRADFAGDLKAFQQSSSAQPLLLLAALISVYIVLGVLYESLAHPLTIISTLPSAGLGALLALQISGTELSVIAFIGIILLIGIVKKNGIMMVDFALDAERRQGLSPERAIHSACLARFRPILMTTLAAIMGALPLVVAIGPGAELRRPLAITIIGGLVVSQILTLYTTPVIYLMLDKLHRRLGGMPSTFVRRFRSQAGRQASQGG
jgi:hydrophobe/amphiphile efflux-1 (HAE1) family protein